MRLCNSITAKVLVWLAAILVPAETLPLMACDCGGHCPQSMAVTADRANAALAVGCPHCTGGWRPRHSCCGGTAASPTQHGNCCDANGSCCGRGGLGSHGSPYRCSANKSVPAPDPLP